MKNLLSPMLFISLAIAVSLSVEAEIKCTQIIHILAGISSGTEVARDLEQLLNTGWKVETGFVTQVIQGNQRTGKKENALVTVACREEIKE